MADKDLELLEKFCRVIDKTEDGGNVQFHVMPERIIAEIRQRITAIQHEIYVLSNAAKVLNSKLKPLSESVELLERSKADEEAGITHWEKQIRNYYGTQSDDEYYRTQSKKCGETIAECDKKIAPIKNQIASEIQPELDKNTEEIKRLTQLMHRYEQFILNILEKCLK